MRSHKELVERLWSPEKIGHGQLVKALFLFNFKYIKLT
nr:MAG TPA: hypothetical protein [Caudoviricetes sp.]